MGGKAPYSGKMGINPLEGGEEVSQEQEVNFFTKGKGKGVKGGYWPSQGGWSGGYGGAGFQGACWGCGELGHPQRECPKAIQNVDCSNIECDFFFGSVEADVVEEPPPPNAERTFRRVTKGVKVRGCGGSCSGTCNGHWNKAGNKFAALSEEGDEKESNEDDVEDDGKDGIRREEWRKMLWLPSSAPNRGSEPRARSLLATGKESRVVQGSVEVAINEVDLCNVEGEGTEEKISNINVDFQVAAVKKPLISVKRICEKGKGKSRMFWARRQG